MVATPPLFDFLSKKIDEGNRWIFETSCKQKPSHKTEWAEAHLENDCGYRCKAFKGHTLLGIYKPCAGPGSEWEARDA